MADVLLNGNFETGTPGNMATSWSNPAVNPTAAARETTYSSGLYGHRRPDTANGYLYIIAQLGTTGASEPEWPTTTGDTVEDGTVIWKCAGSATGTCVLDDTVYRSGAQSLKFSGPGFKSAYQEVTVSGNKKYSLSGYIKQSSEGVLGEESELSNFTSYTDWLIRINNTSAYSPIFTGTGLNDCTLGGTYSGTSTSTYQVQIDSVSPGNGEAYDTFKWRKGTGTWTETVEITGAAQALAEGITATFGATTGHTADDLWYANVGWRYVTDYRDAVRDIDWTYYYMADFVTLANDSKISIQIYTYFADASYMWLDDFTLMETEISTPDSTRELIYTDEDYTLFAAHQQDDVFQSDAAPAGDAVTEITINAVANERVSWQLVVNPAVEWTNVTWSCTDFASGANTIDADDLVINRVTYIDVGTGVAGNPYQRTGASPEALPIEASSTLVAEENNTFFFTVHVPSDAVAGTYTGTLTLVKDSVDQESIDVEIVVADVLLPVEPYMKSQCGVYFTLIGDQADAMLPVEENYWNHRCFKNGHTAVTYDGFADGHYSFSGAAFAAECAYYAANMPGYVPQMSNDTHRLNYDGNSINLQAAYDIVDGDGVATTDFAAWYPVYLQDLAAHYASLGVDKVSLFFRDEDLYYGESSDIFKAVGDAIIASGEDIEFFGNYTPNPDWPDKADGFFTSAYRLPAYDDVTFEFTYPGIYANSFMTKIENHQPIKLRLFCWALYKDGFKANQFWTTNAGTGTPWTGDYDYPTLIYPPRDGVDTADTPVNSTRWEAYRQGLQDADLLWTLHDLIAAKTGRVAASYITAAQTALDRVDEVVTHLPRLYQAAYGCHNDQFCTQDIALVEEVRAGVVTQLKNLGDAPLVRKGMYSNLEMEM